MAWRPFSQEVGGGRPPRNCARAAMGAEPHFDSIFGLGHVCVPASHITRCFHECLMRRVLARRPRGREHHPDVGDERQGGLAHFPETLRFRACLHQCSHLAHLRRLGGPRKGTGRNSVGARPFMRRRIPVYGAPAAHREANIPYREARSHDSETNLLPAVC